MLNSALPVASSLVTAWDQVLVCMLNDVHMQT